MSKTTNQISDIGIKLRELADAYQQIGHKLFDQVDHCTVQEAHDHLRAAFGKERYFTIEMKVISYSGGQTSEVSWEIYVQDDRKSGTSLRQEGPCLPEVLSRILILNRPETKPVDALAAADAALAVK